MQDKLDRRLRQNQAELAAIFDGAPIIMILVDRERRVRRANRTTLKATGRSSEEMMGRRGGEALRCVHSLDSPNGCGFGPACQTCGVRLTVQNTFNIGQNHDQVEATLTFASEVPPPAGEKPVERHLLVSTTLLNVAEEQMVLVSIDDITDRKQAEEKLREAELCYRTIADFNYDWELWENPDGTLRYTSPSCERITGYTAAEFINNPNLLVEIIVPEDKNIWAEHHRDIMAVPRQHGVQFRIRRRDGQIRWLERVCQPVIDEQDRFLGYRASNRDISIRKQAEADLYDSVQKLHIAYKQTTVYAQELKQEITDRKQAQAEIEKLNAQLEQRIADRTRELAALYDATAVASTSLDLETMLEQLLKSILLAVRSNSGYIHLLGEADGSLDDKMLHLAVAQGLACDEIGRIKTIALEQGLAGWVARHDELLVVPNVADDPRTLGLKLEKKQGYTGAPIRAGGKVLGALSVLHAENQSGSAEEVALLASIADQVGIIVESARLRRQAEQAAIMAERDRLARDLHDAVTQSLYSLTLFAETGLKLAETGQIDSILQTLTRIREVAIQTLKEMRLMIHELKPLDLSRGLAEALHCRLHTVEERANIKTKLITAGSLELPLAVEEGLYRIAQEALNNALKHATATEVTVHLDATNGQVELEIFDNGKGFNPNAIDDTGGMGLANMRERAERLGGWLAINSKPIQGTQIKVAVKMRQDS